MKKNIFILAVLMIALLSGCGKQANDENIDNSLALKETKEQVEKTQKEPVDEAKTSDTEVDFNKPEDASKQAQENTSASAATGETISNEEISSTTDVGTSESTESSNGTEASESNDDASASSTTSSSSTEKHTPHTIDGNPVMPHDPSDVNSYYLDNGMLDFQTYFYDNGAKDVYDTTDGMVVVFDEWKMMIEYVTPQSDREGDYPTFRIKDIASTEEYIAHGSNMPGVNDIVIAGYGSMFPPVTVDYLSGLIEALKTTKPSGSWNFLVFVDDQSQVTPTEW